MNSNPGTTLSINAYRGVHTKTLLHELTSRVVAELNQCRRPDLCDFVKTLITATVAQKIAMSRLRPMLVDSLLMDDNLLANADSLEQYLRDHDESIERAMTERERATLQ